MSGIPHHPVESVKVKESFGKRMARLRREKAAAKKVGK